MLDCSRKFLSQSSTLLLLARYSFGDWKAHLPFCFATVKPPSARCTSTLVTSAARRWAYSETGGCESGSRGGGCLESQKSQPPSTATTAIIIRPPLPFRE